MATIPIVDTQDKRIGLITSVLFMVLLLVIMWLIQYEIADPPPKPLHLEAAEPLDKTIVEHIKVESSGGGGGDPSSDPVNNNTQVTQQVITNPKSTTQVNSGNANSTNTHNSNNPPSGNNTDNPFAGGTGGGTGGGNGTGIGSDSGPGTNGNGGAGNGGARQILAYVNANDIQYNYDVKFVFNVTINEDGYVIDVRNVNSLTTTSDAVIIRKVMELVKQQVRYSKAPGAAVQTLRYTVNFKAT